MDNEHLQDVLTFVIVVWFVTFGTYIFESLKDVTP